MASLLYYVSVRPQTEKDFRISAEVLRTQLKVGFHDVPVSQVDKIWVAYEPVWSIGVNGTPQHA